MCVLMRPTLIRQGNVKLLRYLGGTNNLEYSKLIHTSSIAVSSRDNILDRIDLYPKVGRLGFTHHDDHAFEVAQLFKLTASDQDDSCLSKEYLFGLLFSSRLETGYPRLLGRQCHGYLLKSGFVLHQYMKASLERLHTMEVILHSNPHELDTCSYNLILVGFIEKGYLDEALVILRRFMLDEDMVWNKDTYIVIFGLCSRLKDLKLGRQVHNKLLKSYVVESDDDKLSICNALIKMYGKYKEILYARNVFDRFEPPPQKSVVIWNTIFSAYSESLEFDMPLKGFIQMQREDVGPNESTFSILLNASTELHSLRCGNSLHALLVKTGFKGCKKLEDTLINMYSRTGDIKAAEKVFLDMTICYIRDTTTWNVMINGYSLHSYGNKSLALFQEMLELGEDDPNEETFVGVLSACGHMGLVEEGFYYLYELMKQKGVKPGLEHYMCIINMLIKAGQLNEALSFIVSTPSKWDAFAWSTFFRRCNDYALGIRAAELIPGDVATKVSKWFGVAQVREVIQIGDIECEKSWMQINNETHEFDSVYKSDPEFDLQREMMKMFPYYINFWHESEIEDIVMKVDCCRYGYHSEKLALAYAIINGPHNAPICIIKTSGKICCDCHTLMKLTSKVP